MLTERFGLGPDDVVYLAMPMFHSNAIMAGWAVALASGATVALERKFTASGFLPAVRRFGATYANYVGKPLAYVLATPQQPDDADNPLRIMFGNEANEGDIAEFARRFGCTVVDSYGSTENAVIVQRQPDMPPGSLGWPIDGVKVLRPDGTETPDAEFDTTGRLTNADAAIGELVNTAGAGAFAGYYRDEAAEAERMRGGMYWSGDLAYRDADGWIYFAGRTGDWLRVDGENLATAPIERILLRHPAVSEASVYALPDRIGDKVACALVLRGELTAAELWSFLAEQPDLSSKAWPSVVRILDELPRTATNKVLKRSLRDLPAEFGERGSADLECPPALGALVLTGACGVCGVVSEPLAVEGRPEGESEDGHTAEDVDDHVRLAPPDHVGRARHGVVPDSDQAAHGIAGEPECRDAVPEPSPEPYQARCGEHEPCHGDDALRRRQECVRPGADSRIVDDVVDVMDDRDHGRDSQQRHQHTRGATENGHHRTTVPMRRTRRGCD